MLSEMLCVARCTLSVVLAMPISRSCSRTRPSAARIRSFNRVDLHGVGGVRLGLLVASSASSAGHALGHLQRQRLVSLVQRLHGHVFVAHGCRP
jgi:hypothetical protein